MAKDLLVATETGTHVPRTAADPVAGTPSTSAPASFAAPAGGAGRPPDRNGSDPDAPARIEVEMPRGLYDRLVDRNEAPRSRYDMATGRAEYVAEPSIGHERRAAEISELFILVKHELHDAGHPRDVVVAGASRLLSDDGAFEPDVCVFVDPRNVRAVRRLEGYLDTRKGHPVPDLVAEIDRSADSGHKLAPYFRMGVREAWTWSRRDGARIRVAGPGAPRGSVTVDESRVLPGLARDDLDHLLAGYRPGDASRRVRALARRIARALVVRYEGSAPPRHD